MAREEALDQQDGDEAEDKGNHVKGIEGAAESHFGEKGARNVAGGEEFDDLDADAEDQDGGDEVSAPAICDPEAGDHVDELDDEKIADVTTNELPAYLFVGDDKNGSDEGGGDVDQTGGTGHGMVFTMSEIG